MRFHSMVQKPRVDGLVGSECPAVTQSCLLLLWGSDSQWPDILWEAFLHGALGRVSPRKGVPWAGWVRAGGSGAVGLWLLKLPTLAGAALPLSPHVGGNSAPPFRAGKPSRIGSVMNLFPISLK